MAVFSEQLLSLGNWHVMTFHVPFQKINILCVHECIEEAERQEKDRTNRANLYLLVHSADTPTLCLGQAEAGTQESNPIPL